MKAFLQDIASMTAEEFSDNSQGSQLVDFIDGAERAKEIIQQFIDKAQSRINGQVAIIANDFGGDVSMRELVGE